MTGVMGGPTATKLNELMIYNQMLAEDILEASNKLVSTCLTLMVVIIVFAILIIIFMSSYMTKLIALPMTKMVETAKEVVNGNLNVKIATNVKDEIGDLSRSFAEVVNIVNVVILDM